MILVGACNLKERLEDHLEIEQGDMPGNEIAVVSLDKLPYIFGDLEGGVYAQGFPCTRQERTKMPNHLLHLC
jgi:hypothetical protein